LDSIKDTEAEAEKSKGGIQTKKQELQKDLTRESSSSPLSAPKALLKKSSRFFSASFFSFSGDETELTAASVFQGLMEPARKQLPKFLLGLLLFGAGYVLLLLFTFISITVNSPPLRDMSPVPVDVRC
jgi:hypothetical protein